MTLVTAWLAASIPNIKDNETRQAILDALLENAKSNEEQIPSLNEAAKLNGETWGYRTDQIETLLTYPNIDVRATAAKHQPITAERLAKLLSEEKNATVLTAVSTRPLDETMVNTLIKRGKATTLRAVFASSPTNGLLESGLWVNILIRLIELSPSQYSVNNAFPLAKRLLREKAWNDDLYQTIWAEWSKNKDDFAAHHSGKTALIMLDSLLAMLENPDIPNAEALTILDALIALQDESKGDNWSLTNRRRTAADAILNLTLTRTELTLECEQIFDKAILTVTALGTTGPRWSRLETSGILARIDTARKALNGGGSREERWQEVKTINNHAAFETETWKLLYESKNDLGGELDEEMFDEIIERGAIGGFHRLHPEQLALLTEERTMRVVELAGNKTTKFQGRELTAYLGLVNEGPLHATVIKWALKELLNPVWREKEGLDSYYNALVLSFSEEIENPTERDEMLGKLLVSGLVKKPERLQHVAGGSRAALELWGRRFMELAKETGAAQGASILDQLSDGWTGTMDELFTAVHSITAETI